MPRSGFRDVGRRIAGSCALAISAGVAALLVGSSAGAQGPHEARLEYTRGAGAEHCPDEASLRSAVAARLGYDPFREGAPRLIAAAITRAGRGLRAKIQLIDAAGEVTGARELASSQNDCSELVGAVTLAISIAVDPQSELRPAPPAPPPPAPEEPPSPPPAPQDPPARDPSPPAASSPAPPAPPRSAAAPRPSARKETNKNEENLNQINRIEAHAGLAGLFTVGTAPGVVSLGLAASAGLRRGAASISLEARADLPTSAAAAEGGAVSAWILLGTLAPCYHVNALLACPLVSGGVLWGEGQGVEESRRDATPFAAAGGRIGLEIIKVAPVSARLYVDVTATLTPTSLHLNDRPVWSSPPVGVVVGIAGFVHFL